MSELLHQTESPANSGFGTMYKRGIYVQICILGRSRQFPIPDALKMVSVPHFGDFVYVGAIAVLYLFFVQSLAYVVRRSEPEMDVLGAP